MEFPSRARGITYRRNVLIQYRALLSMNYIYLRIFFSVRARARFYPNNNNNGDRLKDSRLKIFNRARRRKCERKKTKRVRCARAAHVNNKLYKV